MYWRIGGVEHYVLSLEPEAKAGAPRQRPRSATFSGLRPSASASTPSVTRWAGSPCRQLLAGVTQRGVYLWNAKPFALLSSLVYETDEFGHMVDLVWAPLGDRLFVVLSRGYIYEINVQRRDDVVLEYRFATKHYYARGPGEEHGIRGVGLAQRRTFRLPSTDSPVLCVTAAHGHAMVATRTHVYRMTWAGALASSSAVEEIYAGFGSQDTDNTHDAMIVQLGAFGESDAEYFVFDDGSVRIVGDGVQALDGLEATALDYSAASGMAAVGTATGTVHLFALEGTKLERVGRADGSGQVTGLRWAPDGAVVASTHASGHVVVRTLLGREINATRVGDAGFVAWGVGARLFVGGARGAWALAFARAMGNEGSNVSLFSDDTVFVQTRGVDEGAVWRVEHVAASYTGSNAPMRVAAASADGCVAVAGARGLAVRSGGRWRLQRTARERTAEYTALAWYGAHVAAACVDHERNGVARLEFWAGVRALDMPVASIDLDAPAVLASAHGAAVLVLSQRGVLSEYALTGAQVTQRRAVDVGAAGVDAQRVRAVQWVPGARGDDGAAVLLVEGAWLRVVSGGRVVDVAHAELAMSSSVNIGSMHSAVWWYDGAQLLAAPVSLDDFMAGGARALERGPRVCMTPDFYPLAIAADRGMVVGLDQDAADAPGLAQLPLRGALFLPALLAHMLQAAEQDALMYAASFEHRAFFAHAMEMLLHDALVNDMGLPRTVRMLAHFALFDDIVVHCARKTEAAFWPRLFACVGGAARFFERCVAHGRLRTAAQCLLVLQTLEPPQVATRCVLVLLDRVAHAQSRALCVEVMRFLRATATSDTAMHALYARLSGTCSDSI